MARDRKACQKAIAEAWKRERQLALEGKGTREWTEEQQLDIIELGKAFDDDGIAFEGQHMKSALAYPDQQGNPDNIQLLSKVEHLAAHKGDFRNPTNWYYDPVSLEFIDFGDNAPIACKAFDLKEPIAIHRQNATYESPTDSGDNSAFADTSMPLPDYATAQTETYEESHGVWDWIGQQWEYAKKHPFKTAAKVAGFAFAAWGTVKAGKAIKSNFGRAHGQSHHLLNKAALHKTNPTKSLTKEVIKNVGKQVGETVQQSDVTSRIAEQALDSGAKAIKGLSDYSALLTKGYSTNLPQEVRREILNNALSENGKQQIIKLLRFLISTRSGNKLGKYEKAISIWKEDLDFIINA